jgi:hypothetical protein
MTLSPNVQVAFYSAFFLFRTKGRVSRRVIGAESPSTLGVISAMCNLMYPTSYTGLIQVVAH